MSYLEKKRRNIKRELCKIIILFMWDIKRPLFLYGDLDPNSLTPLLPQQRFSPNSWLWARDKSVPPKRRNPDDKGEIKTYFSFSSQPLLFLYTTHKGLSRRRRLENFLGGEKGGKGREDGSTQNSIWRHHLSDRKRKKGEIFAFAYVVVGERTSIGRSPFFLIFRQV